MFHSSGAMAVQHKRLVGRQEFGSYPLIRLRPPPEVSLSAYVRSALEDERHLGTRAKFPRRNCVRPDGQKFVFYDNFLARSRERPISLEETWLGFNFYLRLTSLW